MPRKPLFTFTPVDDTDLFTLGVQRPMCVHAPCAAGRYPFRAASARLGTTGLLAGEIAAASGYASDSAFSAMFKAAMGQSPSRFAMSVREV